MSARARAGERPATWSESQESMKLTVTLHVSRERHNKNASKNRKDSSLYEHRVIGAPNRHESMF
jgi:hypothetical protein